MPGASGPTPAPQSPCAFGLASSLSTPGPSQHHHCSFLSTGVNTCCISHSGWLPSGQRYMYCPNPSEDGLQVAYLKSQTILTSWEEFQGVLHNFPDTQASFGAALRFLSSSWWLFCHQRHICCWPSSLRAGPLKRPPCQSPLLGQCPHSQHSSFPSAVLNGFPTWFFGK